MQSEVIYAAPRGPNWMWFEMLEKELLAFQVPGNTASLQKRVKSHKQI